MRRWKSTAKIKRNSGNFTRSPGDLTHVILNSRPFENFLPVPFAGDRLEVFTLQEALPCI